MDYPTKQPPATLLDLGHPEDQYWGGGQGALSSEAGKGGCCQAHGPCVFSKEWYAAWPCLLLVPALKIYRIYIFYKSPPNIDPSNLFVTVGWVISLTVVEIQSYSNFETNIIPIETKSNYMEMHWKCFVHISTFKHRHLQGLLLVSVIYIRRWCLK